MKTLSTILNILFLIIILVLLWFTNKTVTNTSIDRQRIDSLRNVNININKQIDSSNLMVIKKDSIIHDYKEANIRTEKYIEYLSTKHENIIKNITDADIDYSVKIIDSSISNYKEVK